MENSVYIVAATRTPIGKLNGAFSNLAASDLGAAVITGFWMKLVSNRDAVSEVILGQVLTGGTGQNPARQAALKAGVPAMTINKVCGAGHKSIHLAAQAIRCGDADIVIAGGQDSMTQAPHRLYGARSGGPHGRYGCPRFHADRRAR